MTSKINAKCEVVHSNYASTTTLSVTARTYYNLFTLPKGIWLVTITGYVPSGTEFIVCHSDNFDNAISENSGGGQSGSGVVTVTSSLTVQLYSTNTTNISRFKAEAVRLA